MKNRLLASVLCVLCAVCPAAGQSPQTGNAPDFPILFDLPWQPANTELLPRPNKGPAGYKFYGNVDYIMWWAERDRPVLSLTADPAAHPGNVLLPDATDFGAPSQHGARAVLGTWLDQQQTIGLELGGFWLAERSPHDSGVLPDVAVRTQYHNELWGAEAQLRAEMYRGTWVHFDFLAGLCFLSLDEALGIAEHDLLTDITTADRFGTRNRFYGGQLGAEMEYHYGKYFVDVFGKAALGGNCETVNINGTTLVSGQALPGGILAVAGQHHRNEFAVVPQVGINVGGQVTQHIRAMVGYTFLYLSDAARPGTQADALVHSPSSSSFPFQSAELWLQGLNLGLEFRF